MLDYYEPDPVPYPAQIKTGLDGRLYVVFRNSSDREGYMATDNRYDGRPIASFGQFENAVCIG